MAGDEVVECGVILVNFAEDEATRLLWIGEHVETLVTISRSSEASALAAT
jgi:hypothetical protein